MRLENYDYTIRVFSRAIGLDSTYTTAYAFQGLAYAGLKRYEEALKDYNEAIRLYPDVVVGQFASVQLVFAWTKASNIPLLLGQVNFFMEFDLCFYRSKLYFEVNSKTSVLL